MKRQEGNCEGTTRRSREYHSGIWRFRISHTLRPVLLRLLSVESLREINTLLGLGISTSKVTTKALRGVTAKSFRKAARSEQAL
jgi:hypothetical protein